MRYLLVIAVIGCGSSTPSPGTPTLDPASEPDEQACMAGDAKQCIAAGRRIVTSTKDLGRGGALFARACELGDMAGCGYQATLLVDYPGHEDLPRALELFTKACTAKSFASCTGLAGMYRAGLGVPVDERRAIALYEEACTGNDGRGCNDLGVSHEQGVGVAIDIARANQLYERACNLGDAPGCTNLGFSHANGNGFARDDEAAFVLYTTGCDGGDARGCSKLAVAYLQGVGVAQNSAKALESATAACEDGSAEGCVILGAVYHLAPGVEDFGKALAFYIKGCDAREPTGCINAAVMYRDGQGMAPDLAKATELVERACRLGHPGACGH